MITANTWFNMSFEQFRKVKLDPLRKRFQIRETGFNLKVDPVPAFINHGAWLVKCPHCGGAEYAWEERYFYCCSCKNSYLGHQYRRLSFPDERKAIEAILELRPLENRNWKPGETTDQLILENKEHRSELITEWSKEA